jgi:PAS domain S-box-containing protein
MNHDPLTMPPATPSAAVDLAAAIDVIDALPLPYLEMDRKGSVTRANRATLALHPLEHGDLIGKMAWDLMATDEKEAGCAAYLAMMESGQEPPIVLRSLYTRGGEFRIYEVHRSLMRDQEGRPVGMRNLFVDVTDAKRALDEANRSRLWLESVLESVAAAVVVTDALGIVSYINPAAETLFGWKARQLIGKAIEEALPLLSFASDDQTPLSLNLILDKPINKGMGTMLDRDRRQVRVEIATSPIVAKNNGFITGVVSVVRSV